MERTDYEAIKFAVDKLVAKGVLSENQVHLQETQWTETNDVGESVQITGLLLDVENGFAGFFTSFVFDFRGELVNVSAGES